ncbi:MAG: LysE family transporter [Bacteroidia bacterium]|nr:LysE family transporter [Bacteroidia bacterium]
MIFDYLIKGLLIGFSIAAPVGPIGVLVIRRTLTEGRLSGFVTGLGAAVADGTYGFIAGFGLTSISSFLISQQFWMKLFGGLFLLYLGIKTLISKAATKEANIDSNGLLKNFTSTLLLTITNPITILSFFAIFAGLGLGQEKTSYLSSTTLVLGVFVGSAFWWLILSSVLNFFSNKITSSGLTWINRFSGLLIISFACFAFYSLL